MPECTTNKSHTSATTLDASRHLARYQTWSDTNASILARNLSSANTAPRNLPQAATWSSTCRFIRTPRVDPTSNAFSTAAPKATCTRAVSKSTTSSAIRSSTRSYLQTSRSRHVALVSMRKVKKFITMRQSLTKDRIGSQKPTKKSKLFPKNHTKMLLLQKKMITKICTKQMSKSLPSSEWSRKVFSRVNKSEKIHWRRISWSEKEGVLKPTRTKIHSEIKCKNVKITKTRIHKVLRIRWSRQCSSFRRTKIRWRGRTTIFKNSFWASSLRSRKVSSKALLKERNVSHHRLSIRSPSWRLGRSRLRSTSFCKHSCCLVRPEETRIPL